MYELLLQADGQVSKHNKENIRRAMWRSRERAGVRDARAHVSLHVCVWGVCVKVRRRRHFLVIACLIRGPSARGLTHAFYALLETRTPLSGDRKTFVDIVIVYLYERMWRYRLALFMNDNHTRIQDGRRTLLGSLRLRDSSPFIIMYDNIRAKVIETFCK